MSGLEPLAALGLACSVMQTITFAGQTLSLCRKIYNDGQPDPTLNDYSMELSKISETLENNLNKGRGVLSSDDLALRDTAEKCLAVANMLAQEIRDVSPPNGQKRIRTSIRLGFKALFRKPRLEQLEMSLRNIQSAMNTQLLVRTLDQVDASTVQQESALIDSRRLLEDTIQQCSSKNEKKLDLITQGNVETQDRLLQAMNNAQSRVEAHIKSESSKNTQLLQTQLTAVETNTQRQFDQFQEWKDKENEEAAYQRLLQSLKCENIEERKNQITENHPDTYHWIFEPFGFEWTLPENLQNTQARSSHQLLLPEPGRPQAPPWIVEESENEFLRAERAKEEIGGDANFGADSSLAPLPENQLFFPAFTGMSGRSADDGNDEPLEDDVFKFWYPSTEILRDPPAIALDDLAESETDGSSFHRLRVEEPVHGRVSSRERRISYHFTGWLVSKGPVYWISGKPGSGKSTLMKFISSNPRTKRLLSWWEPEVQIFSHYFWKAGSEMQQSLKGLLCSLMYQIFCENRQAAVEYLHKTREIHQKSSSIADWDTKKLEALLQDYISESPGGICLFIDGLDEFAPQRDRHDLLFLLDRISGPRVKLCLSSRLEQVFQNHLQCHASLRMQDLTEGDMREYATGCLGRAISSTNKEFHIDAFVDSIVRKADGVFLWVVLVCKSLMRGIENGDSHSELRQRLGSMPGDLAALYKDMWLRSNDDREIYQKTASWFFNIVFAAEPRAEEPIFSPLPCMSHSSVSVFELMAATDPTVLDRFLDRGDEFLAADIDRRCSLIAKAVKTRSAGLLEVSDESVGHGNMTVRFIHRTARDYLFESEDGRSLWQTSEISANEARTSLIRACLLRCHIWPRSAWVLGANNSLRSFLVSASRSGDKHCAPSTDLLSAIKRAYESGKLWSALPSRGLGTWDECRERSGAAEAKFLLWAGLSGLVEYTVSRLPFMRLKDDFAILDELLHHFCQGKEETKHEDHGPLIRCLLQQGASPNTDDSTLTSPWVLYLSETFHRVSSPRPAGILTHKASGEISQTLRAFLEADASLSVNIPVQVTLAGPHLDYECLTVCPQRPSFANVLLHVNATWLINRILEHLDAEAKASGIGHERVPSSAEAVIAMCRDDQLRGWHRYWRIRGEDAPKVADEISSRLRSSAGASRKIREDVMKQLQDMMEEIKHRAELVEVAEVPGFLGQGDQFYRDW